MTCRTEPIYILYGSQTGNSEQAAKQMCLQLKDRLSPAMIQNLTGTKDEITVEATHMQLDDFLELERAKWTRLVVIIVSSYGVGQAPLGAYRFRELCDAWVEQNGDNNNNKILDGVYFALCGLGDSKYTTFFQNPTKINQALQLVGARRVGPLGKADASGSGKDSQNLVIERWIDGIWSFLAQVVSKDPLSVDRLNQMQQRTIELCQKINPDFLPETKTNQHMFFVPVLVALLAVVAGYFYLQNI